MINGQFKGTNDNDGEAQDTWRAEFNFGFPLFFRFPQIKCLPLSLPNRSCLTRPVKKDDLDFDGFGWLTRQVFVVFNGPEFEDL